jgi:hypothetical protein
VKKQFHSINLQESDFFLFFLLSLLLPYPADPPSFSQTSLASYEKDRHLHWADSEKLGNGSTNFASTPINSQLRHIFP